MEDILLHIFFVGPLIRFILKPDNSWNKKNPSNGILLSILVLIIVGYFEFHSREQNYYEIIGLSFGCSRSEMLSSYRKLSLKYHPDKNTDESAKELFDKIRNAHDVLSNNAKRRQYNRFGDLNKKGDIGEDQFWDVFFVIVLNALIPLFFGLLYSIDSKSYCARKVFLSVLALCVSSEIILRFSNSSETYLEWIPYFSKLTPFEKIKVFQALIPLTLNGALLIAPRISQQQNIFETYQDVNNHLFNTNVTLIKRLELTIESLKFVLGVERAEALNKKVQKGEIEEASEDLKCWDGVVNCFSFDMEKPENLDLSDLLTKSECNNTDVLNEKIKKFNEDFNLNSDKSYFKGFTFASFIFISFIVYKLYFAVKSLIYT